MNMSVHLIDHSLVVEGKQNLICLHPKVKNSGLETAEVQVPRFKICGI